MKMTKPITLCLFCISFLLSCARSPKEKAISSVVHHLQKTLKDPSSYIPVQFNIESWHHPLPDSLPPKASIMEKRDRVESADPLQGWVIVHKFKCRSGSGAIKDTQLTFYINSGYQIENVQ